MKESRFNIWGDDGVTSYVFNGVSGQIVDVPGPQREAVARLLSDEAGTGTEAPCDPDLLRELVLGRMLVNDDFDELAFLKRRYDEGRHQREHMALTIVTSLGCNFDCPYCYEAKHPSILSEGVAAAILKLVDDRIPPLRALQVSWFGGEPLLGRRPLQELSRQFMERCARADVAYSARITTNGYLLDRETCRMLASECAVTRAQVTLDGPPAVHDRMRPLVSGRGTFEEIVKNLEHAVEYMSIDVRVNVDEASYVHSEELLRILRDRGLAGKVTVYLAQLIGMNDGSGAPSESYGGQCFTNPEFANAQLEFNRLARAYGFAGPELPQPLGPPCTAVRANDLVIGSRGELYKCYESIGNAKEIIGNIHDYNRPNSRIAKWLSYDPFADNECNSCIALPVCMGGCAHHALDSAQYDNRCDTFRHTYREQLAEYRQHKQSGSNRTFITLDSLRLEKAR